ncbi:hypothetical protein ES695_18425 [Candidatus Atribacteria bacterium 1244-E10-H5-B2]|nr:MAG: hypothetical protein ES695_18425 [Candidatus Atribacteria bacterium 1244-E10-H5-B2]
MKEEIKKVLEMLEEKKISNEEATELLEALKESKKAEEDIPPAKRKRFLKIHVTKGDKPQVNVTLPFGLINWGLNIASKMGKNVIDIGGEKIPINIEELSKAINDPEFTGKIVDVEDEEEGKHVEIEIV